MHRYSSLHLIPKRISFTMVLQLDNKAANNLIFQQHFYLSHTNGVKVIKKAISLDNITDLTRYFSFQIVSEGLKIERGVSLLQLPLSSIRSRWNQQDFIEQVRFGSPQSQKSHETRFTHLPLHHLLSQETQNSRIHTQWYSRYIVIAAHSV